MSGYEQRAREWLGSVGVQRRTEMLIRGKVAPMEVGVADLVALCESIAAEARGQAIEECRQTCHEITRGMAPDTAYNDGYIDGARHAAFMMLALAPRPDVRLVAREDLAHALGTCPCEVDDMGCVIEPHRKPHYDAIDRLRAGEEG